MASTLVRRGVFYAALVASQCALSLVVSAQQIEWSHQLDAYNASRWDVSADGLGHVYVTGHDWGSGFYSNAFVSKYDATGALEWTRHLANTGYDHNFRVAADKLGNLFVLGLSDNTLFDRPDEWIYLAFVAKFDSTGAWQWTRELDPTLEFLGAEVATDGLGNFYVTGHKDVYSDELTLEKVQVSVSKFDEAGSLQWTRQFGDAVTTQALSVAADALGNVYVGGYESGVNSLESDAFVAKYDAAGEWQWKRELDSTVTDIRWSVSADSQGNVYLAGNTGGSLEGTNAGGRDAFVARYHTAGTLQWIRQFGSSEVDSALSVSADGMGNIFLSGTTRGNLAGISQGGSDAFVSLFDASGVWHWTRQFGSPGDDTSESISADGLGNAYFASVTSFPFWSPDDDLDSARLTKIKAVPQPGAVTLALMVAAVGSLLLRRVR